jgi:hypothetical protein
MVNKTSTVGAPFQYLVVLASVETLYAIVARPAGWTLLLTASLTIAIPCPFRFPMPLDGAGTPAMDGR